MLAGNNVLVDDVLVDLVENLGLQCQKHGRIGSRARSDGRYSTRPDL